MQLGRKGRNLLILAAAGIGLRLLLAPITGHPFDIAVSYNVSASILKDPSPTGLPQYLSFIAVTPAYFYMLVPISYLYFYLAPLLHVGVVPLNSLPSLAQSAAGWTIGGNGGTLYVTNWLYNLLIKTPFILADLGSGLLIYKLVSKRYGERVALTTFALWFFNPMLVWVSAVWGMFDGLAVFFVLLSAYFLLEGRNTLSAVSLAVAVGFKLYPLFLIVPIAYYMVRGDFYRSMREKLAIPIASFCATFVAIFALSFKYLLPVVNSYLGSSPSSVSPSSDPSMTYGLTYWSAAPFTGISGNAASDLSLLLFVTLGVGTAILSLVYLRRNRDFETLLFAELITTCTVFFAYLRVNEQWFIWLLPPLILLSAARRIGKKYVIGLSVLALLYSMINSLFAAFFLSFSLYAKGLVGELYSFTIRLEPYRLGLMAVMGISFSALLAFVIFRMAEAKGIRNRRTFFGPRREFPYYEEPITE